MIANVVIGLAAAPFVGATGYLFGLTLLSAPLPTPAYGEPHLKFDIVVPSHDEELNIAATVESLLGVDYPRELFRVLVVADNCSDATAARARAAGATVLERTNKNERGKGYALAFAFERVLADGFADAVVVVDADTTASKNLLRAFAARIEQGAVAMQAEYGVRNPDASWRTRLMKIALSIFHDLRSRGRERLGVSCGLRGNGMAFVTSVLKEVPHEAFSIVEDVEYGIRLGRAGHRVWYAHEAHVLGEMVATEKESRSQRARWEGGRMKMVRAHGLPLLREAIEKRSLLLFDLAMDVLVPPLSWVVVAGVVGGAASVAVALIDPFAWPLVLPWIAGLGMVSVYVLRGVAISGTGVRGLADLAAAPFYVGWKIVLAVRGSSRAKNEWVRTAREGERAS